MASQVEIANRALTKLGAARIISFDDDNKQARAIKSMFAMLRDAEMRSYLWSFTIRRTSLAALSSTPSWGFKYEYQLPSDCLKVIQVNDYYTGPSMGDYRNQPTAEFAIEGKKILTDFVAPLKIKYCARVEDTTQWGDAFVEAFACKLAYELAEDLTQSNTKKESVGNDYQRAISLAIRANAIEQPPQDMPDDSWMLSRI